MVELFTREGHAPTAPIFEIDGKPFFTHVAKCHRCGGAGGHDMWRFTGWTCFRCGGGGLEAAKTVPLFTAEKLAKLDATRAKTRAAKAAKAAVKAAEAAAEKAVEVEAMLAEHGALLAAAEPFLAGHAFLAEIVEKVRRTGFISEKMVALIERIVAEKTAEAARAPGAWVGEIGEKIELPVEVVRVAKFERACFRGRGTEIVHVTGMRTEAGDTLVAMTPAFKAEKGERFTVKGTVKAHKEFRGEKETVIIRVAAIEAPAEMELAA